MRYDIAIIGTGPAGLEAALTAKARNKSILLIGSKDTSQKVEKAHSVMNYLGLPQVSGENMKKAFLEHIESEQIEITEDMINAVYAMGEYFMLQGHQANYEASTVILACGMSVSKPFEGELENLGRGVSYCATCDANLYRGKTAIVVGYSSKEEAEAAFLAEVADKVTYIALYDEPVELIESQKLEILSLSARTVFTIEKTVDGMKLNATEGLSVTADGIFILRDQVAPSQLVPGLSIEDNHVPVDRQMNTNIPGLFACGDITGAPYQYIKAAGEGNVAALSAVNYMSRIS